MITNQPHTPDMNMSTNHESRHETHHETHGEASDGSATGQLTLDGFADPLAGIDPRFILSDETCRIGRKYLAEMRRILANGRAQTDIQNGRALAAQHDGRAQAA